MNRPAFVISSAYEADIGAHVFPTFKYRRVKEALLERGLAGPEAFTEPVERDASLLRLAHDPVYLQDLFALRRTRGTLDSELPITAEIVRWFELAAYGTVTATELALDGGGAMHIGGGFHHAFADHAPAARPFLHLGATSAYVGDNADLVMSAEALDLVNIRLLALIKALRSFALNWADLPALGFTHLQAAQPTTVGKRA